MVGVIIRALIISKRFRGAADLCLDKVWVLNEMGRTNLGHPDEQPS